MIPEFWLKCSWPGIPWAWPFRSIYPGPGMLLKYQCWLLASAVPWTSGFRQSQSEEFFVEQEHLCSSSRSFLQTCQSRGPIHKLMLTIIFGCKENKRKGRDDFFRLQPACLFCDVTDFRLATLSCFLLPKGVRIRAFRVISLTTNNCFSSPPLRWADFVSCDNCFSFFTLINTLVLIAFINTISVGGSLPWLQTTVQF